MKNDQSFLGVKIIDKMTTFISEDAIISEGVTIYENNHIAKGVKIGKGTTIYPFNWIENSTIGENCIIISSHIKDAIVQKNCTVGPFARLRQNAVVEDEARIGNFVEIKNARIGKETKASHLAYIGDADVGENCNIGCGAIFVNYDGKKKNHSKVGNNCFIGSNCNIIAPVTIGNGAFICAGTTITKNIEDNDFVIGRAREEIKKNRAQKYLSKIPETNQETKTN